VEVCESREVAVVEAFRQASATIRAEVADAFTVRS
jgi:hypothetical protein